MSQPIVLRFVLGTSASIFALSSFKIAMAIEHRINNEIAVLQQIKDFVYAFEKATIPSLTQALQKHNERKTWWF
jgi:hypothetical protein